MVFKALHLSYDNNELGQDEIIRNIMSAQDIFNYKNEIFIIEKKLVENRYIWMYCQYDNEKLHGDVIFDTRNDERRINTRDRNEVELRRQLFVAIDTKEQLIYLSDIGKKTVVKEYLTSELHLTIFIKNVYSSLEDFQKSVKYLRKLKFTQYRNILNVGDNESIFMQQSNALGLDMPEKLTMQLEYKGVFIGDIREGLQTIKQKKEKGFFEDIVIVGLDDLGIEHAFNFSSIIKSIEVSVSKNDDERYDEQEVARVFFETVKR